MKRKLLFVISFVLCVTCTNIVSVESKSKLEDSDYLSIDLVFELDEKGNYELKEVNGNRNYPEEVVAYIERISGTNCQLILDVTGDDLVEGIKASSLKVKNKTNGTVYYNSGVYFHNSASPSTHFTHTIYNVSIPTSITSVRVTTTYLCIYYYSSGWLSMGEVNDICSIHS